MSEEVFAIGALVIAFVPSLVGMPYFVVWLMGRNEDLGEMVKEAILTTSGFEVIERREFPALTEEFFRGFNSD